MLWRSWVLSIVVNLSKFEFLVRVLFLNLFIDRLHSEVISLETMTSPVNAFIRIRAQVRFLVFFNGTKMMCSYLRHARCIRSWTIKRDQSAAVWVSSFSFSFMTHSVKWLVWILPSSCVMNLLIIILLFPFFLFCFDKSYATSSQLYFILSIVYFQLNLIIFHFLFLDLIVVIHRESILAAT